MNSLSSKLKFDKFNYIISHHFTCKNELLHFKLINISDNHQSSARNPLDGKRSLTAFDVKFRRRHIDEHSEAKSPGVSSGTYPEKTDESEWQSNKYMPIATQNSINSRPNQCNNQQGDDFPSSRHACAGTEDFLFHFFNFLFYFFCPF